MNHFVVFPILNPYRGQLRRLMNDVAEITRIDPPHIGLPPHISVCRLSGVDERILKKVLSEEVVQARQARMTLLDGLFAFGKHYIVRPVLPTQDAASLWTRLYGRLSVYDKHKNIHKGDGTLHVTIASRTSGVFDRVWPALKKMELEPMCIPLTRVVLYREKIGAHHWEMAGIFPIPPR